jgi:DME family drug/metabolite transporter
VLVAAACFGTLGPVSALAYERGIEPIGLVAWRGGLGALALGALILALRMGRQADPGSVRDIPKAQLARLAVAVCAAVLLNLTIFTAFGLVTVAIALLGFYTYPAFVAAAETVLQGERLDRPRVVGLMLALGGMALVLLGGLDPAGGLRLDPLGVALALLAAAAQTVYVTVSRRGFPDVPVELATEAVLAGSAAVFTVGALVSGAAASLTLPLRDPALLGLVAWAGVAGAGLASLLFLRGVRTIGGTRTGVLAMFEPVVGVALAALVLAQPVLPVQIGGGVLVLAAGVVLQASGQRSGAAAGEAP